MKKRKYGHKRKKNRKFLGCIVCTIKARLWLLTMTGLMAAAMTGCSDEASKAPDIEIAAENTEEPFLTETDLTENDLTKSDCGDEDSIGMIYGDIYNEIAEENAPDSLEMMRRIISRLGEKGYAAVDSENQIDMSEAEQALEFCEAVDEKKSAELTVIVIEDLGFRKFDLKTEKGNVYVIKEYYRPDNSGYFQKVSTVSYPADLWQYTEEGYLIFEGSYDSEEDFALTLSDVTEHTALRILPLDETCRELNRKYILPVGYKQNNLFLTDWNEEDFGDLDFYDVFDCFYPILYQQPVPYVYNENLEIGAIYQIPEDIFENVITIHFNIDTEKLRLKTAYLSKEAAYEYRPRGFYEVEYPEIPYPEVVDYRENSDGTITLTINAVYPEENTSKAYSHRTVIRPLSEEGFQYVSNEMIPSENNFDIWWHSDRLTEEEWQETYGGNVDADRTENGYNLPISNRERKEAEADCKKMMNLIWESYREADKGHASNVVISEEVMGQMADKLKSTGYPVTTTAVYSNMENYKKLEDFLNTSMAGISGSAVVYEIHSDGGMGRYKYFYDGKDMYVLSAKAAWSGDNKPVVPYISYTRMKKWRLTEKGWFCYELCVPEYPEVTEIMNGSRLFRVRPMTEENRRMSEKCVLGLGYQGNNLLCSNWDPDHMERLDYNGMYEYLYVMKYQERFPFGAYPKGIPKEEFEHLIMEYLPITAEEIRNYAVFDEENQTYEWAELSCINYAPAYFGTSVPEVTHIKKNREGALTLTVDAVCDMILCGDAVITHELTVRFMEDGSFQYLGNKILDDGIKDIPDYQYRIYAE